VSAPYGIDESLWASTYSALIEDSKKYVRPEGFYIQSLTNVLGDGRAARQMLLQAKSDIAAVPASVPADATTFATVEPVEQTAQPTEPAEPINVVETGSVSDPTPDRDEIARAFSLLKSPGDVVELRSIKATDAKGYSVTVAGFYNDLNELVNDTYALSSNEKIKTKNIYWTLQQLMPATINNLGSSNGYKSRNLEQGKLTNDDQVARYKFLPIDFDPARPADTSSSEEEKKAAFELATTVRDFLSAFGIVTALCDSGNGNHLLATIDLGVSSVSTGLIKNILAGLASKFQTAQVGIDTKVYNPSRIWKVYGTVARKGPNTTDRPWRVARILDWPALTVTSEETLRQLLAALPVVAATENGFTKKPEGWLDEPFIHRNPGIDNQLIDFAGYYIGAKNIRDPKELYVLLNAKLEENGCFEPDGTTPFKWNDARVREIAETKVKAWGKGEDYKPGHELVLNQMAEQNLVAASIEGAVVASSGGSGLTVERPKLLTEVGNARRLIETYGKNIRFSSEDGIWLYFGGKVWQLDRHGIHIDDLMKRVLITMQNEAAALTTNFSPELRAKLTKTLEPKSIYDKATKLWNQIQLTPEEQASLAAYREAMMYKTWAVSSESNRAINGAIDQAKSEPGMTIANSALDSNINVCNVLNGTFDFNAETAGINFRPHLREDYCTRMVNADYIPGAECPKFKAFFAWMFPDPEVRVYLQKFFGLCLTGILTRKIIVLWGEGRNGKGALMKTLQGIFGEVLSSQKEQLAKAYSVTVSVATFSIGQGDQAGGARADLMPLKGSRLIVASEVNRGSKNKRIALDMARLKEMTGGDETVARGLYQAEETRFTPQGKIVIQTNNMPDVADDSDGAWERIKKVNCGSVVTDEELDEALHEKMLGERSGILNWLLEGLALFFKDGFGADPAAIAEATEEFRGAENHMARFVEDSCEVGKGVTATAKTPTSQVYSSYKFWCQQNGESADTQRALTMYLKRRHNVAIEHTRDERLLCRIRIKGGALPVQLTGQLTSQPTGQATDLAGTEGPTRSGTEGVPEGANAVNAVVALPRSNNVDLRSPGQF
jgi:putative DNA primase/helicase